MSVLNLELAGGLPEGWVPVDVVSVVKCLDEDGDTALCVRTSGTLSTWEIIGMLTAANDASREALQADFKAGGQ